MAGAWRGEIGPSGISLKLIARWTTHEADGLGDGLAVLRASVDCVDIGDVDAIEAGGVGIDDGLRFLADVAEPLDLPALPGAACEEVLEEEEGDVSFSPQEARTLFSTLTVSSRNINDNWSL